MFTKRFIKNFLIIILIGGLLFIRYLYYFDFKNDCNIRISPSFLELSNGNVKRAIRAIKNASPQDYQELCVYVEHINPNLSCGGFGGGCFYNRTPKSISISTSKDDFIGTIGILAHEVCHAIQFEKSGSLDEKECYGAQDRILREITQD